MIPNTINNPSQEIFERHYKYKSKREEVRSIIGELGFVITLQPIDYIGSGDVRVGKRKQTDW